MPDNDSLVAPEVFYKAAEFVRRGWTQRTLARDKTGTPCEPQSRNATCWCMLGAIRAASTFRTAYRANIFILGDHGPNWNDDPKRTQQEVIDFLMQCGEKAEQRT